MDREKLKWELSKFRNEQCSHIDAFHYSAITCDDCVVNFIDRILADETRELVKAFEVIASLTIPGNDEDGLYHIGNIAAAALKEAR